MAEQKKPQELIDYISIIWKRKGLILIPSLLLAVLAGGISFLLPPVWEVDIIILPSKFLVETTSGQLSELLVTDPRQIAGEVNQKAYDRIIAAELNINTHDFPNLKDEHIRDTKLVRVFLKEKDVEKGKAILRSLFKHLKKKLDTKADIEINNIDTEIAEHEFKIELMIKEIASIENKLAIIDKREKEILTEMKDSRERIKTIEAEHLVTLKKDNRQGTESLALLLYFNEIQQNLRYINSLHELLTEKKIEQEDLQQKREGNKQLIETLRRKIINFKERKGRIDYTTLSKEPTPSVAPVSPKKKLSVLLAGMLGLMLFTLLAFFLEYIKKQKTV